MKGYILYFDLRRGGGHYKGVEYIGSDEKTTPLRSRPMGTDGSRFMYTYGFEGDTSTGRWRWPNPDGTTGGYTYMLERSHADH